MGRTEKLNKYIKELGSRVDAHKNKIMKKEKCLPMMLIAGIIAPVIIWLALYFIQPNFVQTKEGDAHTRSNKKVFYWSALITVLIWVGMYLWSWCQGYANISMLCSK